MIMSKEDDSGSHLVIAIITFKTMTRRNILHSHTYYVDLFEDFLYFVLRTDNVLIEITVIVNHY